MAGRHYTTAAPKPKSDFRSYGDFKRVGKTRAAKVAAQYGIEYLDRLPDTIPSGKRLVHGPQRTPDRLVVWLEATDDTKHPRRYRVVCGCRLAPWLGAHYRSY